MEMDTLIYGISAPQQPPLRDLTSVLLVIPAGGKRQLPLLQSK